MTITVRRATLVAVTLLVACDGADDRPATWSYIHAAIIAPACATAGCHSQMTALAGVDLSRRDGAYAVFVGRVCGAPKLPSDAPGNYVFPGQPERSQLPHLLRGDQPKIMPPDMPLPEIEVELIERWILEDAPCD